MLVELLRRRLHVRKFISPADIIGHREAHSASAGYFICAWRQQTLTPFIHTYVCGGGGRGGPFGVYSYPPPPSTAEWNSSELSQPHITRWGVFTLSAGGHDPLENSIRLLAPRQLHLTDIIFSDLVSEGPCSSSFTAGRRAHTRSPGVGNTFPGTKLILCFIIRLDSRRR